MTRRAEFRFHAELNDLLPAERRRIPFTREFGTGASVKDVIEALGVPHTEVDVILVNGAPVDFAYRLEDGDRISVYPPSSTLDVPAGARLQPPFPTEPRFVLDAHLGRLGRYLRLLGFDSLHRNDYTDATLAAIAGEGRILLTRDVDLLKRRAVIYGYYVRATDPRRQVLEVAGRFRLANQLHPFVRCMACNGMLEEVAAAEVAAEVPEGTRRHADDFRRCTGCGQVFWRGAHYPRLAQIVEEVRRSGSAGEGD